ncbi:MAG: hypothetical protein A3205_05780 [Methanomassiliicoccales archaeon Mx-03]|nr:MAG: hypothetical protein A3205_05780 [Methanomassiliicoccales archaeon Mx-03]
MQGRSSKNHIKPSDKGKRQFYRAHEPTQRELASKDDRNQVLLIDEVQQASTTKMRIVITWVPAGHRKDFRKQMDSFDARLKNRGEVKYANTTPDERLGFYESVIEQEFEVYDSIDVMIPDDVVRAVGQRQGYTSSYWESRYIFQLEAVLQQALSDHAGRVDIIIDNPPLDIVEEIRAICERFIRNGCDIRWLTVAPSRHIVELQTHDLIAGLDYDVRTGQTVNDPRILRMVPEHRGRYESVIEKLKTKFRSRKA